MPITPFPSHSHPFHQALQQGNNEGARIYASNAIRKKSESLNLLRLSSRIDAVASRVETAVTMRQVTGNMTSVVRGMDKAMESMNLERVSTTQHQRSAPPFLIGQLTRYESLNQTDFHRDGQVRIPVFRSRRPDIVHGRCDGVYDCHLDSTRPD